MHFEWDDMKEQINIARHGIDFATAAKVFADNKRLEWYDEAHSDTEDRYVTIGEINGVAIVVFVVYTERSGAIRLISARKATKRGKGGRIMIIRKDIDLKQPLTSEQKLMLENLKTREVYPDDDAHELSEEQLRQFARASQLRREERRKQSVTIRLSPQALNTARSLGKGYTSVLSRILESALKDADTLKHFL